MKPGSRHKVVSDGGVANSPDGLESFRIKCGDKLVILRIHNADNLFIAKYLGPSNPPACGDEFVVHTGWINSNCERVVGCYCDSYDLLHFGHMPECVEK